MIVLKDLVSLGLDNIACEREKSLVLGHLLILRRGLGTRGLMTLGRFVTLGRLRRLRRLLTLSTRGSEGLVTRELIILI